MHYIVAKYQDNTETVDTHEELEGAQYLRSEYQLAYGQEWEVWISLTKDGPPMEGLYK